MKIRNSEVFELFLKYKEIITYLFFGGATTAVNWVVYIIFVKLLRTDMTLANAVAWILAVTFAYITNKLFVFESKVQTFKGVVKEAVSFLGARAATGLIEIFLPTLLYKIGLGFTVFGIKGLGAKALVSIIGIIMNYVLSKLWIFNREK